MIIRIFLIGGGGGGEWSQLVVAKQTSPLCNYESIKILGVGGTLAQSGSNIDLSSHLAQSPRQLTASQDINSQPRLCETQLISDHPRDHSHSPQSTPLVAEWLRNPNSSCRDTKLIRLVSTTKLSRGTRGKGIESRI